MLGALIIAVAVVVVFAFATGSAGAAGRPYVVAARPLPAGSIIGPGDTTTQRIDLPAGPAHGAFGQAAVVIGRTLAVAVAPGELIESSMLAPAGSGPTLRPVSVPVETTSLGALSPGSAVDVLSVPPSSTAGAASGGSQVSASVSVVMRGATLLSVDRAGSGLISQAATTTEVTLGVADLAEAEAVIQAAQAGEVVLIQAEPPDGVGPGAGPTTTGTGTGPTSATGTGAGA